MMALFSLFVYGATSMISQTKSLYQLHLTKSIAINGMARVATCI